MSLVITETVRREAYTVIDGKNVVFHSLDINSTNPSSFNLHDSILDHEMYKANKAECRQNIADFEDSAYALVEEMVAKKEAETANEATEEA